MGRPCRKLRVALRLDGCGVVAERQRQVGAAQGVVGVHLKARLVRRDGAGQGAAPLADHADVAVRLGVRRVDPRRLQVALQRVVVPLARALANRCCLLLATSYNTIRAWQMLLATS